MDFQCVERLRDKFFAKFQEAEEPMISVICDFMEEEGLTDDQLIEVIKKDKNILALLRQDSENRFIMRKKNHTEVTSLEEVF